MGRVFSEYGTPLKEFNLLKYLVRTLSSSNDYWPEVEQNLRRARVNWVQLVNILGREVADRRTAGIFYVAVVQEVLLFGSDMWVMTPRLEKALGGFRHRSVRQMVGMFPKRQQGVIWVYPPIGAALATVVLYEIGVYIARR